MGNDGARRRIATRERAIRADERAKVEREVVAWLREQCCECPECYAEPGIERYLADAIERGEHRPNPGQPKEGE